MNNFETLYKGKYLIQYGFIPEEQKFYFFVYYVLDTIELGNTTIHLFLHSNEDRNTQHTDESTCLYSGIVDHDGFGPISVSEKLQSELITKDYESLMLLMEEYEVLLHAINSIVEISPEFVQSVHANKIDWTKNLNMN